MNKLEFHKALITKLNITLKNGFIAAYEHMENTDYWWIHLSCAKCNLNFEVAERLYNPVFIVDNNNYNYTEREVNSAVSLIQSAFSQQFTTYFWGNNIIN